ncbi:MAG: hypothetical protein EOP61_26980, partial [Sphingomonadales bacterium]
MAAIVYDLLETGNTYPDFRYGLFTDLFGKNSKPYVDASGVARIGPAIDLEASLEIVATQVLGAAPDIALLGLLSDVVSKTYEAGDSKLLQNRLDKVLKDWASENGLPNFPDAFVFANDNQVKAALAPTLVDIEGSLENWGDIGIPLSEERAVVASLAYRGYDVSNIMDAMVFNGDRIAPWIEIRYMDRAGAASPNDAGAARRYYQSAQFELYNNPDSVAYDEAVDVGQAYTGQRNRILSYEKDFNPAEIGLKKDGGRDGIADFLQPAIDAVAQHYFAEVRHADELLFTSGRT